MRVRKLMTAARFVALVAGAWGLSPSGFAQAQDGATAADATANPRAAQAGAAAIKAGATYSFKLEGTRQWADTNMDLRAGEKLRITAAGSIKYPADKKHPDGRTFGPQGLARGFEDLIRQYEVADAGRGALIARVGSDDAAQPFLVGDSLEYTAPVAGRLFLGLNQSRRDAEGAKGEFAVKIVVLEAGRTSAGAALAGGPADSPVAFVTSDMLQKIPRRVKDPQGNPGDMVNLLMVGSEEAVLDAFKAAGWVEVDKTLNQSIFAAVIESLDEKTYLTMPVSTLYLFGRPQDHAFAHAQAVKVAMTRHHLRIWEAPQDTVPGQTVWCVAATHDIGFERDQRNNGITHKIDPDVDKEREYVNETLSETGLVSQRMHILPSDPLTAAKTATGGEFHSDGRVVVLVLREPAGAQQASASR